jgi:hypothetical protein
MPTHLDRWLCRFTGTCCPNLSNRIVARSFGPMKPRGVAWNGRGQLSDRFAVAARELLAHSLDHLPLAQDDLQCLGDILAELGQFRRSPSRTTDRSRNDDALSRDIVAKRFADWPLALKRAHHLGLLRGFRRGEFVFRRGVLRLPRGAIPFAREVGPCAPSAAHRSRAGASRSRA